MLEETDIEQSVAKALIAAFQQRDQPGYGTSSLAAAFFRVWMKEDGNAYYFLFHKNLRVTNMQHAELVALVAAYTFDAVTKTPVRTVQFASTDDFIARVQALLDAVPGGIDKDTIEPKAEWFAATYAHLLYYTAVVDAFFGSSSIHLPPHLDMYADVVCGTAGYVHSCGRNVFVRNVSKATYSHLKQALGRYLLRFPADQGRRLFFQRLRARGFSRN